MLMLKLEDCLEEQGTEGAWIKLTGKATGSRVHGPTRVSNYGEYTGKDRLSAPGVHLREGSLAGPTTPMVGLFTPTGSLKAAVKDADWSLEIPSVHRPTEELSNPPLPGVLWTCIPSGHGDTAVLHRTEFPTSSGSLNMWSGML